MKSGRAIVKDWTLTTAFSPALNQRGRNLMVFCSRAKTIGWRSTSSEKALVAKNLSGRR
jgi:hypothetical protein